MSFLPDIGDMHFHHISYFGLQATGLGGANVVNGANE